MNLVSLEQHASSRQKQTFGKFPLGSLRSSLHNLGTRMQPQPTPFFREAGTGPGAVCLHSNASSSSQWRGLMDALAPSVHVLAADSFGAGKSPTWPVDHPLSLQDEVALLEPVFARAGDPFVLVGHSYGAAVALIAAVSQPQRVRALALYEPTLFSVVDAEAPPPNNADGIRGAVAGAAAALDAGNPDGAAACFIDYWMGPEPGRAPLRSVRGRSRHQSSTFAGGRAPC